MGKKSLSRLESLKTKVSVGTATLDEEGELNALHKLHMLELSQRPEVAIAKQFPVTVKHKIPRV